MKLKEIQRKAQRENKDAVINATAYGHKVNFTE